ncbi:MAG: RIP metalloprotease RseP [Opitutales bacterium]|jgi:RIP metalloprotease RseP
MDNLSFGDLLSSFKGIALVAIFFGGSIFVHELGHFLAARKRGLKIERFSIGFGPRLFGWTGKDGVDYRVSIIPLGGYVALPQLAEMEGIEGASSEEAEKLPKISYADKMIVSVMGAVFNVIFAFVLAFILWFTGMPVAEGTSTTVIGYVPEQLVTSSGHLAELGLGNTVPGPAYKAGLRSGDKVLAVDDNPVANFNQITEAVMLGNRKDSQGNPTATFKVERDGKELEFVVQPARIELNSKSGDKVRMAGLQPRTEVIIGEPAPNSPAAKAGLKAGDRVLSIDGQPLNNTVEFRELLRKGGAKPRTLLVEREGGVSLKVVITPQLNTTVNPVSIIAYGEEKNRHQLIVLPATQDLLTRDPAAVRDQLMVLGISPDDPALAETLKAGTIIDKVDGRTQIVSVRSLEDLEKAGAGAPRDLTVYWKRANGDAGNLALRNAQVRRGKPVEHAQIGTYFVTKPEMAYRNPWETCAGIVKSTFTTLGRLFDRGSDIQVKQLASVISITKTYYNISEDIRRVLWFTVLINLNLAVLNLMPIPVLDGGHMLIATIQRFTKGVLNSKAVIILQYTFMGLLLSLMAYIILHDVRRCSGDSERQLKQQLLERHVYKQQEFSEKK